MLLFLWSTKHHNSRHIRTIQRIHIQSILYLGPIQRWQHMFYLVLILVFLTNIFCLCYFIRQRGLVTDFTETQNLFALAVNSPPSQRLGGSCGAGPQGDQLNVDFHVEHEENTSHFLFEGGE
ncbi:hypothetical protein EYC84_003253 [Monilinia fructicola]|uniref:Uncharacterized protein n=1 Tax=Monilinia fructicola TaxID=38448 RepID=A0A5M9JWZ9_MONFR|nr:hypothetical protein EYC84_003253 [Monilinia fructicola]